MAKSNNIQDRIRKLLNLADDASSPEEAAIAASRAAKLLAKHNLDRSTVMLSELTEDGLGEASAKAGWKRIPEWVSVLVVPVAKLHDCEARYGRHGKGGNSVEFLGEKDDIAIAAQVFDYLLHQVWSLGDRYRTNEDGSDVTRKQRVDFRNGASRAVLSSIMDIVREREAAQKEAASCSGTALVVLKQDLIKAKYNVSYSNVKSVNRLSGAYYEGQRQGANVSIASGAIG